MMYAEGQTAPVRHRCRGKSQPPCHFVSVLTPGEAATIRRHAVLSNTRHAGGSRRQRHALRHVTAVLLTLRVRQAGLTMQAHHTCT
jgi:hypothetical protein